MRWEIDRVSLAAKVPAPATGQIVFVWIILAFASLGVSPPSASLTDETGSIHGRILLDLPSVQLAQLGPMVAYLEGDWDPSAVEVRRENLRISQSNATFSPDFLVVAAGQTVEMPNDDRISHNVFSVSPNNRFDLGIYPKGTSKSVTFRQPEAVRIYCSIHASMNATIFVAPSPYHARVATDGSFELTGVPVGQYRLKIWSRKLPEAVRLVDVGVGEQEVTIRVGLQQQETEAASIDQTTADRSPADRSPADRTPRGLDR